MARKFRRIARRASGFARRAYRGASKTQPSLMTAALYGAGYGAARPLLANLVSPVSSMIPMGQYRDELALGLLGFAAAKWGSGMIRNAGRTALIVESASAASQLTSGMTTQSASGFPIN